MKIAVLTLGCKTNQAESMRMEHALNNAGHQIVDIAGKPDLCIINTCTVTSKADYQSRQIIKKALKNATKKVIITGCYAELNKEQLKNMACNIEVIGNSDKDNIINMIPDDFWGRNTNLNMHARHRPLVKVQDGCNYSCSYCAIPLARGKSRSVEVDKIIDEIRLYESMGYKEIVITGIHLGTYGYDLKPKKTLSFLLHSILKNTNIPRIRLSSLEVKEIDYELIQLLKENRVCKHLHVPLQSGDDNILKLMNRSYLVKNFLLGIERIFKEIPDISIGTDVIVGFPGEGGVEFNNTKQLIESIPFSYLHIFPYSSRPKTKAATFTKQVPETIKKERVSILREIGIIKKQNFIKKNIGKTLDIIVEESCYEGMIGTAGNYIKVILKDSSKAEAGMLVNAHIFGYEDDIAIGSLVKNL